MISLEQIKILDEKVKTAVGVIADLRDENAVLKTKLDEYQSRIEELERLIEDFKNDQGAIEQGILNAIKQLNSLEERDRQPASASIEAPESAESSGPGSGAQPAASYDTDEEPPRAAADDSMPPESPVSTGVEEQTGGQIDEPPAENNDAAGTGRQSAGSTDESIAANNDVAGGDESTAPDNEETDTESEETKELDIF